MERISSLANSFFTEKGRGREAHIKMAELQSLKVNQLEPCNLIALIKPNDSVSVRLLKNLFI